MASRRRRVFLTKRTLASHAYRVRFSKTSIIRSTASLLYLVQPKGDIQELGNLNQIYLFHVSCGRAEGGWGPDIDSATCTIKTEIPLTPPGPLMSIFAFKWQYRGISSSAFFIHQTNYSVVTRFSPILIIGCFETLKVC